MIDKLRKELRDQKEKEAADRRAIRERYMSASPCQLRDTSKSQPVTLKKEGPSEMAKIGNSGHTTREETKIESIIQEPKLKESVV